jgi:deoxyribose-phosphate aldolase
MIKEEISATTIAKYIDHTNVKPDATAKDIKKLCDEAVKYGFHSVCVTPTRVSDARAALGKKSDVEIIVVIGFPFGVQKTEEKILEAKLASSDGATEFDMIINIGKVKEGDWKYIEDEISKIAKAIAPNGLKVIMEIGFLTKDELIKACKIAVKSGAKFVKTSTGYGPRLPNPSDIKIMRNAVGPKYGVKASGGIHDFVTAIKMIKAGANRIGTSSSLQIIGAKKPKVVKEKE